MELFSNIKYKGLGLVDTGRKIGTTCLPPILSISRWHLLKIGSILLALIAVNRLRLDLEELSHTGKVPHFSKFFYDIDLKPPHIDRIYISILPLGVSVAIHSWLQRMSNLVYIQGKGQETLVGFSGDRQLHLGMLPSKGASIVVVNK
ncbi:hypothetical protein ACJX0J_015667 [Zea mays]